MKIRKQFQFKDNGNVVSKNMQEIAKATKGQLYMHMIKSQKAENQ